MGSYERKVLLLLFLPLAVYFLVFLLPLITMPRNTPSPQWVQFQTIRGYTNGVSSICGRIPPSGYLDSEGRRYEGAMKLCEFLVGQDGHGFHRNSTFRADGRDPNGTVELYPVEPDQGNLADRVFSFKADALDPHKLGEIYGTRNTAPFAPNTLVLCDTYEHTSANAMRIGMPILFYKAQKSRCVADVNDLTSVFALSDNHDLLALGVPWSSSLEHPMLTDPNLLYETIWEKAHIRPGQLVGPGAFVLISAGSDGLFGTSDDDCFLMFGAPA